MLLAVPFFIYIYIYLLLLTHAVLCWTISFVFLEDFLFLHRKCSRNRKLQAVVVLTLRSVSHWLVNRWPQWPPGGGEPGSYLTVDSFLAVATAAAECNRSGAPNRGGSSAWH